MKRQLSEIIEHQEEKREEALKKVRDISNEYSVKMKVLQDEEQKRVKELNVPSEPSFLKILKEIQYEDGYFFPDNHDFINELSSFMDDDDEANSILEKNGVCDPEEKKELISRIRKGVKMHEERATFYLAGRVKGYKGDETNFKLDKDRKPKVETEPNLKPWEDCDWSWYCDEEPEQSDIDWPDHKSTWATAVVYVTSVKFSLE